eukprot:108944-Prymnesium_polylepis.1
MAWPNGKRVISVPNSTITYGRVQRPPHRAPHNTTTRDTRAERHPNRRRVCSACMYSTVVHSTRVTLLGLEPVQGIVRPGSA